MSCSTMAFSQSRTIWRSSSSSSWTRLRATLYPNTLRMMSATPATTSPIPNYCTEVLSSRLQTPSLLDSTSPSSDNTNKPTLDVINPADPRMILARIPVGDQQDTQQAIAQAEQVLSSWRDGTTALERSQLLQAWSRAMDQHAQDLATIMTLESGKPLKEALGEVSYARSFLDYYAAEALRPTGAGGGFLVPTPFSTGQQPKGQIMAIQQAIGICACIMPWNFPAAMMTRSVGPALAAGCVSIVKPSEQTPLTALALQHLAVQAGIPPHVLQMVTADRETTPRVGEELCTDSRVRQLHFTGSTKVGKWLYEKSSSTMKKLSLELGGNAPFIVCDDADLELAVQAAVSSKFRNTGQTCVCADRFLVQESVHDAFVEQFRARVESLCVGDGMDENTTVGPMITEQGVLDVQAMVEAAKQAGAKCIIGGKRLQDLGDHFYEPTIMTNVPVNCALWSEETFGPVAAIQKFSTDEEALSIANDSPVGLAGYVFTKDLSRAFAFSKQLETGMVGVNEGVISTAVAPFGGVKQSGLGREGSSRGFDEYLELKYVFMNA